MELFHQTLRKQSLEAMGWCRKSDFRARSGIALIRAFVCLVSPESSRMAKSPVKTSIKPLGDKILIKRDEAKTKTDMGIYLPEAGQQKSVTGIVEAVGDGQLDMKTGDRIPVGVKKGDRVLLSKYGGNEIEIGELKLFFVDPEDILAVIEG